MKRSADPSDPQQPGGVHDPPAMIASLVSDLFVFHNLMMAICLIALAPSVILVLLLRRFVVKGLAAGAMRG
jgi:multiple sugar transport system permease protein